MNGEPERGGGRYSNLFWLFAFLVVGASIVLVWRQGGEWFEPSRENAVVRVFRDSSPAVVSLKAEPLRRSRRFESIEERRKEFFRWFMGEGGPDDRRDRYNYGSGIIVDPRGYILTNEHVVVNSAWVQVQLSDGRTVEGELWGTEPSLDLAVVKIDIEGDLPHLDMGDSDRIMIGEDIVVIGNPLGLGHTCTSGIVSALNRTAPIGNRRYRGLIQIDAAVNPGNSGGPLLNVKGELVGITSALIPDSQGLGFAIPINLARLVVNDLIEYRFVPSGWLGVSVEDLGGAAEAFGVSGEEGVFISRIEEDGPAAKELKPGDIIESFDGNSVQGLDDFVVQARKLRVGQKVKLGYLRDGERREAGVEAEAFPPELVDEWLWHNLGVRVEEVTYKFRALDGRIGRRNGLFVSSVSPTSPAGLVGLIAGDQIVSINGVELEGKDDFDKSVIQLRRRRNLYVAIKRGRAVHKVPIPFQLSGERW